jgi:hypothetical protein
MTIAIGHLILRSVSLFSFFTFISVWAKAQTNQPSVPEGYIRMKASENYGKGSLYRFFWGNHYRRDWHAPSDFKIVSLDTLAGGLTPYQTGGGRQSKSLRVTDKEGHEYVFRSIDKSFGKALPEITQGTFIESLANDQVTISNPYAALVVAPLAEAAGIYHTNPEIYYVPKQKALGKFSDSAGDVLYLFEQRPDEDWSTAANFGNSKNIVGTEKMLEKILDDNDNSVDQKLFLRSRLFDMWIGDWGRHEDQWRWASYKDDKKTLYKPIPRDRDNAFTKFDGAFLRVLIPAAKAYHLQTFDDDLKRVNKFNFPARHLDHHLLNELTKEDWLTIANDLQTRLTDNVIDDAVKKFPKEVYAVSGAGIASKLKARRSHLAEWADTYYTFLSKDVEITGSKKNELVEVKRLNDEETDVAIYKITKEGDVKKNPIYHRIFKRSETNEIRIYGLEGADQYKITGKVRKGIKMRLIGGTDKDVYDDESTVGGPSHKTKIYDNPGSDINKTKETQLNISSDTAINRYDYKYFNYNRKGIIPQIFYNNDDRIYAGLGFISVKQKWRKDPFANTHYVDVKYSFPQKGFSSTYYSTFRHLIGKWDLNSYANFDQIRWTNFYGLGNESQLLSKDRDFYRIRSEEFIGRIGVDRVIKNQHRFYINGFIQTYKTLNDTDRYLAKQTAVNVLPSRITNQYAGAELGYVYQNINDSVLPTKGVAFNLHGSYIDDIQRSKGSIEKYGAETNIYLPVTRKFSFLFRAGGTTLSGNPQFYQYNKIGGSETLRGYQRNRFYGNSTAFSQNDLRFITNFRSRVFNGKIGVFGLFDAARVWLDGESSNTWHTAVGGGIILSPFNRVSISAAYAKSGEDANIHVRIMKPF